MITLAQTLAHLPEEKIAELETVTQKIVETGMASMIILYGSYARGNWKEKSGGRSGKRSDYDIYVLTNDERDCADLRRKVYKMFDNEPTVVQVGVETLGFVNMHLREGQYFYSEMKLEGIILYNPDGLQLAPAESPRPKRLLEIAELDFKHWFDQAQGFWEDFTYNYTKIDKSSLYLRKSAFHLEQCVENCYTAIEIVYSRNNPYEHRLYILRMNAGRFAPEIEQCFPQNTEDEKYLFSHLDAAYIGGRYISEEHYTVTKEQLDYWKPECEKLLEITKLACMRKMDELRERVRTRSR